MIFYACTNWENLIADLGRPQKAPTTRPIMPTTGNRVIKSVSSLVADQQCVGFKSICLIPDSVNHCLETTLYLIYEMESATLQDSFPSKALDGSHRCPIISRYRRWNVSVGNWLDLILNWNTAETFSDAMLIVLVGFVVGVATRSYMDKMFRNIIPTFGWLMFFMVVVRSRIGRSVK